MNRTQRLLIGGFIIPLGVILDQWSKAWVLGKPEFNALGCLDRTQYCGRIEVSWLVDFSMVWNRGMSFGTLQSEGFMRWVLVVLASAIALGFTVWLARSTTRLAALYLSILIAGAIGNIVDRVRFGAVVDFIDVSGALPWFPWVFNVADASVTVGAGLLLLDQFILSRQSDTNEAISKSGPDA